MRINDTLSAIPLVKSLEQKIAGFEVLQGTMDDVFLNITEVQEKSEAVGNTAGRGAL